MWLLPLGALFLYSEFSPFVTPSEKPSWGFPGSSDHSRDLALTILTPHIYYSTHLNRVFILLLQFGVPEELKMGPSV